MSIDLELKDDGRIRVLVDRAGERAVSDQIDPYDLILQICEEAEITYMTGEDEMAGLLLIQRPKIEEGESAQEDDNV